MEEAIATNQIGWPQRGSLRGRWLTLFVLAVLMAFSWITPAHAQKSSTNPTKVRTRASKAPAPKAPPSGVKISASLPPEGEASPESGPVIDRAKELIGARYRRGGTDPRTGFDCSGLVHYSYGDKAQSLPRSSHELYRTISKPGDLKPGDLVFFGRGWTRHVAIYIGNGEVVHASTPSRGVRKDSVSQLTRSLGLIGTGRI